MFCPTEIIFSATTACNLHCAHCFVNRNPKRLIAEDAVKFLKSTIEANSSIDRIGFSGGEPFLYLDFIIELTKEELARYLKGETLNKKCPDGFYCVSYLGMNVGVVHSVNGILKNLYPKGLRISIDIASSF